jgi:hypothetical protein
MREEKPQKQAKWELLREDEKHKAATEERRTSANKKCAMEELVAEENKTIMMYPSTMDAYIREWWELARMEILEIRKESAMAHVAASAGGGGDASASGDGGGVDEPTSVHQSAS